jgi:hypothetical protein
MASDFPNGMRHGKRKTQIACIRAFRAVARRPPEGPYAIVGTAQHDRGCQRPLSTHERRGSLILYDRGVTMTAKRVLVLLAVLIIVVSVPILTHGSEPKSYGRIWVAYPEQAPIWNIYQGGTPLEWMAWPNNYRFDYVKVTWPGDPNNMDIVLDNATGLVWQRRPLNSSATWAQAQLACTTLMMGTGYFMGWRLPQVQELASLVDYSYGGSVLPQGHPFIIGEGFTFWSATPNPMSPSNSALYVDFSNYNAPVQPAPKGDIRNIWCVRGGAPPGGCTGGL